MYLYLGLIQICVTVCAEEMRAHEEAVLHDHGETVDLFI